MESIGNYLFIVLPQMCGVLIYEVIFRGFEEF